LIADALIYSVLGTWWDGTCKRERGNKLEQQMDDCMFFFFPYSILCMIPWWLIWAIYRGTSSNSEEEREAPTRQKQLKDQQNQGREKIRRMIRFGWQERYASSLRRISLSLTTEERKSPLLLVRHKTRSISPVTARGDFSFPRDLSCPHAAAHSWNMDKEMVISSHWL
jgi:hypothetical protein